MKRLENKVIIITGSGGGIGAETAKLAAKEGAQVVITDIVEENAKKIAQEILKQEGKAIAVKHDVASEQSWIEVIEKTKSEFGKINVLVNNAGVTTTKTIMDMNMDEWNKIMDINLNGCVIGMKLVIPEMEANKGGSIINISSVGGIVGMAGTNPYTASKGALRALTKAAAVQFGKQKIRVNSVHPGVIVTPMSESTMKDGMQYFKTFTQLPYLGEPQDIAYGIIFLASDESKFITGAELVIDGGWTSI